jgi:hypothetical protein
MNTNSLIQEVKNKLSTKQKVELFNYLYQDISGKGIKGDTELAHINTFESRILRMFGGSGTINQETGLKQYFGGGGGGGGAPDTTTSFVREAPGIEERKLELMDMSRDLIQTPEKLPDYANSSFKWNGATRNNSRWTNWSRSSNYSTRNCFCSTRNTRT